MNGKERFLAAVRGDGAELCAGIAYPEIPLRDHSEADFGQPWWRLDEADAAVFNPVVRQYLDRIGCDWWSVLWTAPRAQRERQRYIREETQDYLVDLNTGARRPLAHPARDGADASPVAAVGPDASDAECLATVEVVPAETQVARGQWDFAAATVRDVGRERFIYSYTNTPYLLSGVRGFSSLLLDIALRPEFVHAMCARLLDQQRENLRAMALSGLHGVWLQDYYGGAELISREHYREFVVAYAQPLVAAAQQLGLRVIHYFLGDPRGRVDLIATVGADVLLFEEGRKGYGASLAALALDLPAGRPALMGNLAAEGALAGGDDLALAQEVRGQVEFGRQRGRFLFGTGSPPTPGTPLDRLALALATARRQWAAANRGAA